MVPPHLPAPKQPDARSVTERSAEAQGRPREMAPTASMPPMLLNMCVWGRGGSVFEHCVCGGGEWQVSLEATASSCTKHAYEQAGSCSSARTTRTQPAVSTPLAPRRAPVPHPVDLLCVRGGEHLLHHRGHVQEQVVVNLRQCLRV